MKTFEIFSFYLRLLEKVLVGKYGVNLKSASKVEDPRVSKKIQGALKATDNINNILNHVRAEQKLEDVRESIVCHEINLSECIKKVIFIFHSKILYLQKKPLLKLIIKNQFIFLVMILLLVEPILQYPLLQL